MGWPSSVAAFGRKLPLPAPISYLWRVLERVAVEGADLVVAEVDRLQPGQPVQRAPLQLSQPVLAQVEVLQADHVDEAPLESGQQAHFGSRFAFRQFNLLIEMQIRAR